MDVSPLLGCQLRQVRVREPKPMNLLLHFGDPCALTGDSRSAFCIPARRSSNVCWAIASS